MSYIIKETNPFIRVKLTEIGRQRLATGQLTFNQWAVGDSEIDYGYVLPNPPGVDEQVLRPKDEQPNIKTYLKKADGSIKTTLNAADIKILGITVNNPADERGFFNPAGTPAAGWGIQTSSTYVKQSGTVPCSNFTGTDSVDLGTTNFTTCDFVLFIFANSTSGPVTNTAQTPVPYLWFKIKSAAGSTVTLDRDLPDMTFIGCGSDIQFYIYPGCEDPINTYYGSGCTSAYWNTGTLTFDSCCDISIADVPVWNQNNVWCEDMIGTQSTTATHREYGSIDFIGEKQYLGYPCNCGGVTTSINDICAPGGSTQQDSLQKGIGIIHYTNNTISNFYGEFFYIDATQNKILILDVPTVMWHRRTGGGTLLGMRFVSDGTLKTLPNTDIQYYDLIEDSAYVSSPIVVGRVYPQLKVIVISDEELLATMSFKSNRNWSLPMLKATLTAPATAPGLLAPGETLYLTYTIRPTDGLKPSLPCQKYAVITNNASSPQDVGFTIESTGLLSYMRKIEVGWDGFGFYGQEFVALAQIVSTSGSCRPDPAMWKEIVWTDGGLTLDPSVIESQNFFSNDFIITTDRYTTGATYNIETELNMPTVGDTTTLNFGDERFFYGNLETYIGAKIFKTVFSLNVDRSQFTTTTNPTYASSSGGIFNITEVGIYDNIGNLVMIGKFSSPIPLGNGAIANIEMTLDF